MSLELERRALEFHALALELPPAEREAFLRASADSPELLDLLLRMLRVESPGEQLARSSRGTSIVAALHLEGKQLDDYRLVRELGGGAVGRVFEAVQLSLQRRVAVKVLRLEHLRNEEILRRFRQEPELQGKLRHPHIVQVLSTGVADGLPYFAMEYIEGASLAQSIEERQAGRARERAGPGFDADRFDPDGFDLDDALACAALIEKVARALHFAHENGLVHRDIKPHNILVERGSGEPYLSDFGLAKAIDRSTLTASMEDGLRGTLAYMSPEQATEFHAVDARADVYSLGAVLYQMLTRCLPFEADTGLLLLQKIVSPTRHVRPPHHFLPDFDPRLSAICTRALEKDAERRFGSALEMAEGLRAIREGRRPETRPISRLEQVGEWRPNRRAVLAGTLACTPLAGAAWMWSRSVRARGKADLRLELPPGAGAARVRLVPIRAPDCRLDAPVELGDFASGATIGGLDPGPCRVVVTVANGAFAELQRTLEADALVLARAAPTRSGAEGDAMARVEGGRVRATLDNQAEFELACDAFWIDRAPVTNREYREFLESTRRWPPEEWSQTWIDVWNDVASVPRRRDWDDLPVVKVSWARAREFAEWRGKRLPTVAEWLLALGFQSDKIEPELWQRLAPSFAFARPQQQPLGDARPTTSGAYVAFALPAHGGAEHAFGPHRILHPFGNVGHWLEPSEFQRSDSGSWQCSGNRYEAMGAWHFSPLGERGEGIIGRRPEGDASGDLGFRCAKSDQT